MQSYCSSKVTSSALKIGRPTIEGNIDDGKFWPAYPTCKVVVDLFNCMINIIFKIGDSPSQILFHYRIQCKATQNSQQSVHVHISSKNVENKMVHVIVFNCKMIRYSLNNNNQNINHIILLPCCRVIQPSLFLTIWRSNLI